MQVYGNAWDWVWDRFSSVTIDQHYSLPLTLILPLNYTLNLDKIHVFAFNELVKQSFI